MAHDDEAFAMAICTNYRSRADEAMQGKFFEESGTRITDIEFESVTVKGKSAVVVVNENKQFSDGSKGTTSYVDWEVTQDDRVIWTWCGKPGEPD